MAPSKKEQRSIQVIFASILGIALMGFLLINYLKVPILPESELSIVEGKVDAVFEGGVHDLCLRIEGNDKVYYINRGLENGLDLDEMKEKLEGEVVTIKHPSYPAMNLGKSIHLSILRINNETLYDETPTT